MHLRSTFNWKVQMNIILRMLRAKADQVQYFPKTVKTPTLAHTNPETVILSPNTNPKP